MRKLTPARWRQIDEIFAEALDLPADEREALLRERCGSDAELRAEVEDLLGSIEEARAALGESVSEFAEPLVEDLRATLEREELESLPGGGRVGPYRLLRVIGRGGMGAVYLAERADEQFEKRVALKLVKRGMDTDEVLQRFRYERQILAGLEHPNIGRLYDGGAAEDGRPYLVMEHIAGEPVTDYCDLRRLSIDARLRIFETICAAVEHAHRNLVIHRDLKPSNILVTADGTVKLLDFGIAKLLDPAHPEQVPRTRTEMRLLTPEYASPEQIDGAPVTTATDVYSLGVILFELLTGRRPSEERGRRTADRLGLDTGRGRPSSSVVRPLRAEEQGEDAIPAAEVAARRGTTPERLRARLRGDLDTITLKALAEEPERRYPSAEQLLADVQRYRRGLPVLARGESFGYRTAKFVRRHRVVASLSAALLVVLFGFVSTVFLQNQRLEAARAVSEARQDQAEVLIGYMMGDLRQELASLGQTEVFAGIAKQAEDYFMAVPPEELSDEELFRRTEQMRFFGQIRLEWGQVEEALQSFREAYALNQDLVDRDDARPEYLLGLALSHYWIGNIGYLRNDLEEALGHFQSYRDVTERLVAMEPDSLNYRLELSYAHSNIGSTLERMGDLDGALHEYELTLTQKKSLAELQPDNAGFQSALGTAFNKIAVAQRGQGKLDAALQHLRSEIAVRQALVRRDSSDMPERRLLGFAHRWLGELLLARGDAAGSLQEHLKALEIQRTLVRWDEANPTWKVELAVGARLAGQGMLYVGREGEGMALLAESRDILAGMVAPSAEGAGAGAQYGRLRPRRELARLEIALATAYSSRHPDEALTAARAALDTLAPLQGNGEADPYAVYIEASARIELGRALAALGRGDDAEAAWEQALGLLQSIDVNMGLDLPASIGMTLIHLGRMEQARPIADSLVGQGYRHPEFMALVRSKGLLAQR